MPWVKSTPVRRHDCRSSLPWLAAWIVPRMQWQCGKKMDVEGVRVPCGRLWEVAEDGGTKYWMEIEAPIESDEVTTGHSTAVTFRDALERSLYSAWLKEASLGEPTEGTSRELHVLRWVLSELEHLGLAKWRAGEVSA
jgi:hypothetical protein